MPTVRPGGVRTAEGTEVLWARSLVAAVANATGRSVADIRGRFAKSGRLEEIGTHEELLGAGGRYAELFELQAAGYR